MVSRWPLRFSCESLGKSAKDGRDVDEEKEEPVSGYFRFSLVANAMDRKASRVITMGRKMVMKLLSTPGSTINAAPS